MYLFGATNLFGEPDIDAARMLLVCLLAKEDVGNQLTEYIPFEDHPLILGAAIIVAGQFSGQCYNPPYRADE
jgi:hypothetical protein